MIQQYRIHLLMQETQVQSLVRKIPWRRKWQPTPAFLPRKSPWTEKPGLLESVRSESDTTQQLNNSNNGPNMIPNSSIAVFFKK